MMLDTFDDERPQQLQPDELSDSLEPDSAVFSPKSPVTLPAAEDLDFFRQELPKQLKLKRDNIGFDSGNQDVNSPYTSHFRSCYGLTC
jgi:hypothetical protein